MAREQVPFQFCGLLQPRGANIISFCSLYIAVLSVVPFRYLRGRCGLQNTNFGALRVLNDDLVKGHAGFGCAASRALFLVKFPRPPWDVCKPFIRICYLHPSTKSPGRQAILFFDLNLVNLSCRTHSHRDAEIFSYILDGKLTHADSMGNKESLPRGAVQYLSAGSGIRHSEMNDGDETTRFLQIWIT